TGGVTAALALVWTWYGRDYPGQHRGVNLAERYWIGQIQPAREKLEAPHDGPAEEHIFQKTESVTRQEPAKILTPVPALAEAYAQPPATGVQMLLRSRSLILLTLSYAAVGYFEYLFYFWMHYYFEDVLELGKEQSRLYATVVNLA